MNILFEGLTRSRKHHKCMAYHWINNSGFGEKDFDAESWTAIQKFLAEGGCIQPREIHMVQRSVGPDGFQTFRANLIMDRIAREYELYPED